MSGATGGEGDASLPPVQSSFEFAAPPERFEDLVIDNGNRRAVAFLRDTQGWALSAACLIGPPRSGRTTLGRCWASEQGAVFIASGDTLAETMPEGSVCLDEADSGREEGAVLHLLNSRAEAGRHTLLTATLPPSAWRVVNRDLASRLSAMPVIAIDPPDTQVVAARLAALLQRRCIEVPAEVLAYLEPRLNRAYSDVELCATRLAGAAGPGRDLTVALAGQVLKQMYGADPAPDEDE